MRRPVSSPTARTRPVHGTVSRPTGGSSRQSSSRLQSRPEPAFANLSRCFARHGRQPAQRRRDRRRRGGSGPFDHRRTRSTCLARARPGNRSGLRSPPLTQPFGWTSEAGVVGCSEPELATRADGWHWAAPVGGGERAWVTVARWRVRNGAHQGVDVSWRMDRAMVGPGYALVGDAAVILDPLPRTVSCAP